MFLFFLSGLIGSLSIETVIPFILNTDTEQIFEQRKNPLPNSSLTFVSSLNNSAYFCCKKEPKEEIEHEEETFE
uniref:Uncharacterized protein n=1 Tax=Meloidogyne hapla TaxID=6305 RepID=A0A1I8BD39_MELHA